MRPTWVCIWITMRHTATTNSTLNPTSSSFSTMQLNQYLVKIHQYRLMVVRLSGKRLW